jgi:hypothetical protein
VIAGQRDVRTEVREALRASGMLVDFVGSVQEAAAFCQDSTPTASCSRPSWAASASIACGTA